MTEQWIKDLEHDTNEDLEIPIPTKHKEEEIDEQAYLQILQDQYLWDENSPHWKRL